MLLPGVEVQTDYKQLIFYKGKIFKNSTEARGLHSFFEIAVLF